MNIHTDKSQQNASRAAANRIQDKSNLNPKNAPLPAATIPSKTDPFQRVEKPEAEELLQAKFQPLQRKKNNTGLPDQLKSGIENLSGLAMDDVKVHYNSDKPSQLQAHAYAQGTDIHIASGQEKHLAHEAWHVVQQKQGRVKPTMQMKGKVNINDDAGLEREADEMGRKANIAQLQMSREAEYPSVSELQLMPHQLMRHRPAQGSFIMYNGEKCEVVTSTALNPSIKIKCKGKELNIDWATADFWALTPGDRKGDYDVDRRDKEAWQEDDALYDPANTIALFEAAKISALAEIKKILKAATQNKAPTNKKIDDEVILANFVGNAAYIDPNPQYGYAPAGGAFAQWDYQWIENEYRTWHLTIDSDRTLASSTQEAHVGLDVSAVQTIKPGTGKTSPNFPAVKNVFGHIWLNAVPVSRQG